MAYGLKVQDLQAGIVFDSKREPIKGSPIEAPLPYSPEGKPVTRRAVL